jgi:hypothetical protein
VPDYGARFQDYLAAFERGGMAEAEPMALADIEATFTDEASATGDHLLALDHYAQLCVHADDWALACDPLRRACQVAIPSDLDPNAVRLRMHGRLTEALLLAGEVEDADLVAKKTVTLAHALHGEGHAVWAQAVVLLARTAAASGRLREALLSCDEAMAALEKANTKQLASALIARAEVVARLRPGTPVLEAVPAQEDDDVLLRLLETILNPLPPRDWQVRAEVLRAVIGLLQARQRPGDVYLRACALELLGWVLEVSGDAAGAARVLAEVEAVHEERGDTGALFRATARRAVMLEHLDFTAACDTYEAALARAQGLEARDEAGVRLAFGMLLARHRKRKSAATQLRAALAVATQSGDTHEVAVAEGMLGVFLLRGDRRDEARPLLENALAAMPPLRREARYFRSHLLVLQGKIRDADEEAHEGETAALQTYIDRALPVGQRPRVRVEDDGRLRVEHAAGLSQQEAAHADRVVRDGARLMNQLLPLHLPEPDVEAPPESDRYLTEPSAP